ncbi:MAG TPA: hypothetical protein VFF43_23075 [Caldimonas sp.]|jgi:hypothetical protein|nr:hypothetical protein [Caldimonas sp.]
MEEIGHPPPAPARTTSPTPGINAPALQREFLHTTLPRFSVLCRALAVANDARVVGASTIPATKEVP